MSDTAKLLAACIAFAGAIFVSKSANAQREAASVGASSRPHQSLCRTMKQLRSSTGLLLPLGTRRVRQLASASGN